MHHVTRQTRRRGTLSVVVALLGISTVAACSSGSGSTSVALKAKAAAAAHATLSPTAASPTTGPATPAGPASPSATAAAPATAPAHSGAATNHAPTASGSTNPGTTPATTPATVVRPAAASGPAPVAAGTYTYQLIGTGGGSLTAGSTTTTWAAPATTTLTVSDLGGGTQSWTWQPTGQSTSSIGPISTTFAFNSAGIFLTSETVPFIGNCQFTTPVASPPWPVAAGKSFSGQATCGGTLVTLTGQVMGAAPAAGDFVVQSKLTVGGVPLLTEADWYSPARRLPVRTAVVVSGAYGSAQITSSAVYQLS